MSAINWKPSLMRKPIRGLATAAVVGVLALGSTACKDFLDVNTNPNAPTATTANNYLPPMVWWLVTSEQYDGYYISRYSQMWTLPPTTVGGGINSWDAMGYDAGLDRGAQLYRDVYWNLGINLSNMISQSEAEQRWDLAGIGYVLRAWGWLKLTEMHGDIIVSQAFTPDQYEFPFDSQDSVYKVVFNVLNKGIADLQRTDGIRDAAYIGSRDALFKGDATKWLKYAYALKAMALSQFSNKSTYQPDSVIAAVDKSFGPGEDALWTFAHTDPTASNDNNFWGTARQNLNSLRATTFIAGLMDGTQYVGAVDPRLSRMLSPDSLGNYHGLDISVGWASAITKDRPWNLWGFYGNGSQAALTAGRYFFDDKAKFPVMTYALLQFIKAEAALKKGDQATARQAYLNGISSHIDFVNARNAETGNARMDTLVGGVIRPELTQISAAEKAAFLANPAIAPATITLSHIMGQKFIAEWGWSFVEAWMDQRRYHYTDMDPVSGTQVFRGFTLPKTYPSYNNNKPVQRVRPRYNSDYVWNRAELNKIGGLDIDYHTKLMWITEK